MIELKTPPKVDKKEVCSLYFAVLTVTLAASLIWSGDAVSRFTAHPTFDVLREGCVGDTVRWDFYYSTPVIGILTKPRGKVGNVEKGSETVTVALVRMIQATGAQVVPISFSLPAEDLKSVLGSVNGILIPGASSNRETRSRRQRTVDKITEWLERGVISKNPTPMLTTFACSCNNKIRHGLSPTDADNEQCAGILSNRSYGNMTFSSLHDCTRVYKHAHLPLYTTAHSSFTQESANNFVEEAKKNRNSFASSVEFHLNNIENFPVTVLKAAGSQYLVKSYAR